MTLTNSSNNSDDDSSTGSLLVSPTKNFESSWENDGQNEAINNYHFKNSNGEDHDDRYDTNGQTNNTTMDVTFQDSIEFMPHREEEDSFLFETAAAAEDAATPAKRKFSYAAAMEQLDDSWLAPTPKQPSRRKADDDDDDDDGLDLTIDEEEEVPVGKCLETRWSESPVEDKLPEDKVLDETAAGGDDEIISSVKKDEEKEDQAAIFLYSSGVADALAPAPKLSSLSPLAATSSPTATVAQQLNYQDSSILSPNIEPSADATSAIFRHPTSIRHNNHDDQQHTTSSHSLQLGHPVNESYDSVEQRRLQLEQNKNCISSFLADKDRVENDIIMKKAGDGSIGGDTEEEEGGGEFNNFVLETLEEEQSDGENDGALQETDSSIDDDEGYFNNSVLDTNEDEAELTLTQTADCTADSDGFLKKIEHAAENDDEEEDVVHDYYEETVLDENDALEKESSDKAVAKEEGGNENDDMNEAVVSESLLANPSEEMTVENNVTLTEEENVEDDDGEFGGNKHEFALGFNLTNPEPPTESVDDDDGKDEEGNERDVNGPSESPAEVDDLQETTSPVIDSSGICVDSNLESEDIVESKPELTSSRGDSLTFSPSADADDTLELSQQVQNTGQSSEVNVRTEEMIDSNVNEQLAAPEGGAVDDYLEYSTSNQPSSEVEAGADLSFDGNSLSASLDVSLSNIDREALFAGTFSQPLSPIRQNSSSPHDLSQRQDDDLKGDKIQLPAVLGTSPISESSSTHDCKPLLGADLYAEEGELVKSDRDTAANNEEECAVADRESLEDSLRTDNTKVNKGSIFAVLSQVNADASVNKVVQDELPKYEEHLVNEEDEIDQDPSGEDNCKEYVAEEAHVMEVHKSHIEAFADKHIDFQNPHDYELDERNKSLEDLSSYQQSFNSTSSAFLERLRGAAEERKREVAKARFSMERKEQILYEEKEDREVMPTLSEVAEEMMKEPMKRTATRMAQVKPFNARPSPASATVAEPKSQFQSRYSHPTSTSTIGSKRKSPNALRPHIEDNKPGNTSAVSAKPPKRLLSGADASNAKEMNRRRLLQEDEERIRRDTVFRARPLPASTLPRGHIGSLEQQSRMSHHSKPARAGKENSAFEPSSTARAEERAAYNEEKKAREEARRQEQTRKRNALINEKNAEIENLKRYLR